MFNKKVVAQCIVSLLILAGFVFGATAFAGQLKTTERFILSSPEQLSTGTSTAFTLYIGDNISGISGPVKSAYYLVSGSYVGGGSVQLSINNDPATQKTFTLPTVVNPTSFEFAYKDSSDLFNPMTAGEYSYAIQVVPMGVVLSGLGVRNVTTHEYTSAACNDGASANEKMKTTQFFVFSSPEQLLSSTSTVFDLYIGDAISGVPNAVKSLFYTVSGSYVGSGSLQLTIGDQSSTLQTFVLPTVVNPTSFEFVYKDPSNYINPTTAGNYSYSMQIVPVGATISGLGVRGSITYQYKPASCMTQYPPYGDLISAVIDTQVSKGVAYNSMMWKGHLGGDLGKSGAVKLQLAAADSASGPWNFIGGDSCDSSDWYDTGSPGKSVALKCFSSLNNKRYFRYKVRICSDDCVLAGDSTPTIDSVVVNWSP